MPSLSDLTVSIVSHGHGPLLDALLEDLRVAGAVGKSRIVVTLNILDPEFSRIRWSDAPIEWIENADPKGFAANHNRALRRASTPLVLILNPDLRIGPDALLRMLSIAHQHPDAGIVVPRITDSDGRPQDSVRTNLSPGSVILRLLRRVLGLNLAPDASMDWFAGMFMLIPTEVFASVGGFDERFFLYCEDYDLCARVSLSGRRLILDESTTIIHDARRSSHRRFSHLLLHLSSLARVWQSATYRAFSRGRQRGSILPVKRLRSSG